MYPEITTLIDVLVVFVVVLMLVAVGNLALAWWQSRRQ